MNISRVSAQRIRKRELNKYTGSKSCWVLVQEMRKVQKTKFQEEELFVKKNKIKNRNTVRWKTSQLPTNKGKCSGAPKKRLQGREVKNFRSYFLQTAIFFSF